jgi:hypothetical protein
VVEMIRMSAVLEVHLGAAVLSLIIETQAVETMKQLELMGTQKYDDLSFWLAVETMKDLEVMGTQKSDVLGFWLVGTVPTFQTEVVILVLHYFCL